MTIINSFQHKINTKNPDKNNGINQNRQLRHYSYLQQGVLVNNLIKDDSCLFNNNKTSFLPVEPVDFPKEMYYTSKQIEKKWYNNPILPFVITPLAVLGGGAGLLKIFKESLVKKVKLEKNLPLEKRLPKIVRGININKDEQMVLYLLVQDPSMKNLFAAIGVIAMSATGFVLKNFVDGFKEIWVKRQEADIKQNYEKNLIEIETRSFAGKNMIARNILNEKTIEVSNIINNLQFRGNSNFGENEDHSNNLSGKVLWISGIAVLGASILLTKNILKNLKNISKTIESDVQNVQKLFKEEITNFANNPANDVKAFEEKLETYKISELAKDKLVDKSNKARENKKDFILKESENGSFSEANRTTEGKVGQITFASYVMETSSFLYTFIINRTEQTKYLFALMTSLAGLSYLGKVGVEAVKEVQVKKENAKTELQLQDRLVSIELQNFNAKKRSFVEPLMLEFKQFTKKPELSKEQLLNIAENTLSEIKNGPPFVYS